MAADLSGKRLGIHDDATLMGIPASPRVSDQTLMDPSGGARQRDPQATGGASKSDAVSYARGDTLGRYVVLETLGAGGMGVVLAAFDPELERKVAVKVLHHAGGDSQSGGDGRGRLLREAQAMAQLEHPNVVSVYDVGTIDGSIFIAMELVAGRTLKAWLKERSRTWSEILDVFLAAADGLIAAHDKGLVHRDFKPENVMVGDDGRVRVMDFGLVRAGARRSEPTDLRGLAQRQVSDLAQTQQGAVMGTPAYMAPEQFAGSDVGPAADQFSYCVSLWEALHGERPFQGSTFVELATAVIEGRRKAPTRGRGVPRWLSSALDRGMHKEASRRWSSVAELAATLRGGRARIYRRRLSIVGLVVALGIGSIAVAQLAQHRLAVSSCDEDAQRAPTLWQTRANAVTQQLRGDGEDFRVTSADAFAQIAGDWTLRWEAAQRSSCLAQEVEQTMPADIGQRSNSCLELQLVQMDVLTALIADGDAAASAQAVGLARRWPDPEDCLDVALLRTQQWPHDDAVPQVADVRRSLRRASLLESAGHYDEAVALAREALAAASALGFEPLRLESLTVLGSALSRAGGYEEAEIVLREAYFGGVRTHSERIAAQAASTLTFLVGFRMVRSQEGREWGEHGLALLEQQEELGTLREADLRSGIAATHYVAGELDLAEAQYAASLELRQRLLGADHPDVATSLNNLASVELQRGELDRAEELYKRSLDISKSTLGEWHPDVAESLSNLAIVAYNRGNREETLRLDEQALQIREHSLGRDHPDVAISLSALATTKRELDLVDEAQALESRALEIRTRELGPDHPDLAPTLLNLGDLAQDQRKFDAALSLYARALELQSKGLGEDHPQVAVTKLRIVRIALLQGDLDGAAAALSGVDAVLDQHVAPDDPIRVESALTFAQLSLARGDKASARARLEQAKTTMVPDTLHPDILHAFQAAWDASEP